MARPSSWTKEDEKILSDNFPFMSNQEIKDRFFPDRPVRGIESKARKMNLHKVSDAWNEEEEQILRDNYGKMLIAQLQELLPNRTYSAIISHANLIGLKTKHYWTDDEINILKTYYLSMDTYNLAATLLPNHNYGSILDKAHELGLFRRPNPEDWSKEEEDLLKQYYNDYSANELIKRFFPQRKIGQIEKKKRELGLSVTKRFKNGKVYWTQEKIDLLYNVYPNMNSEEFHNLYFSDLSLSAMYSKCVRLGIKKSKEFSSGWKDEEIELCKTMYLDKNILIEDIAKTCDKSVKQVEYMVNKVLKISRQNEWSDAEIKILIDKYPHMSTSDMVPLLDHKTIVQIDGYAHRQLNLRKTKDYIRSATLDGTRNSLQPSSVQAVINTLLDKMCIKYDSEYDIKYYLVDCYLIDYNLMIEVQGDFWHCSPLLNKKSKGMQKNKINDVRKHTYIKNNYGIEVLYLWESDIKNNIELCNKLIKEYIQSNGHLSNYHSFNYEISNDGSLRLIDNLYEMKY